MPDADVFDLIVAKAQPVRDPTPDSHIHIVSALPDSGSFPTLPDWDAYLDEQARQIEGALIVALPGGTYDRLLGRMLSRKASHFRVAHREEVAP